MLAPKVTSDLLRLFPKLSFSFIRFCPLSHPWAPRFPPLFIRPSFQKAK